MSAPHRIFLLLLGAMLPAVGRLHAQAPSAPPVANNHDLVKDTSESHQHEELLKRLYPPELTDPLKDPFDRTVPGGFRAAAQRARAGGVPESMIVEMEARRAVTDVNYPALVAALARLEAVSGHWLETTSFFSSEREFERYLLALTLHVAVEKKHPGEFAQTALRMRKLQIAECVYADLHQVDVYTDLYGLNHGLHFGEVVPVEQWLALAKPGLHLAINRGTDVTGQPFGPQRVGERPTVPPATYRALVGTVSDDFWKPYRIPDVLPSATTTAANP